MAASLQERTERAPRDEGHSPGAVMDRLLLQPDGLPKPPSRLWAWITAALMVASLYMIFIYAPIERTQGIPQKIFYFHVPLAWDAYMAFFFTLVGSIAYLKTGRARWDVLAHSAAEIGVVLTSLVLITGSIWGKTIWGTWWTWDARLTSTLVMWFIYVAYLMLRSAVGENDRGARYAAILGIVGFIDVPIVHMSVTWWRTLHPQPTVLNPAGPSLPGSMLAALMVTLVTMTILFFYLLRERMLIEHLRAEVHALTDRALEQQLLEGGA
ncbi:MAG: cytochrome c biogenesis protein CcsA [Chloroflexota bacterium]